MRPYAVCVAVVYFAGCSSGVELKQAPVSVAGKVSQGGKPVSGVVMIFQPLDDGHMREIPLRKDGTFAGELVSGQYAYYLAKPAATAATPISVKLSPAYFQADMSRTVTVEPGKQLAIALE
jgi:hypothetical protein